MTDQDVLLLTVEACQDERFRVAGLDALDRINFQMKQLRADSIQRADLARRLDWYICHCAELETRLQPAKA